MSTKMSNLLCIVFIYLVGGNVFVLGITVRKYVYQKDISEHCRRRVVPSVFLGKHVIDAHSQVLDFSKMELPYSCFISIRAETGNNIVLVVQLLSEENLVSACAEGSSQLLVYEIGETFGGYWGPLPDSIVKERPPSTDPEPYTRKSEQATYVDKLKKQTRTTEASSETTTTTEGHKEIDDAGDFVQVEVPIVEVVASEVDSPGGPTQEAFDSDEVFDLIYDVTPSRGGQYRTKIIPVVQFAIKELEGRRLEEPRFDMDHDVPMYTPDSRLKLSQYGQRTTNKLKTSRNPYVNRLLNFKSTAPHLRPVKEKLYFKKNYTIKSKATTASIPVHKTIPTTETAITYVASSQIESWDKIEQVIKKLNESSVDKYTETKNISNVMETLANLKHNYSAYLIPDWASLVDGRNRSYPMNATQMFKTYTRKPLALLNFVSKDIQQFLRVTVPPKRLVKEVTTELNSVIVHNKTDFVVRVTANNNNEANMTDESTVARNHSNESHSQLTESFPLKTTEKITTSDKSTSHQAVELEVTNSSEKSILLTGSMVGHESWENVVQAAPVMAELLNKTTKSGIIHSTVTNKVIEDPTTVYRKNAVRQKRKIEAIPIQNARPHNLTMKTSVATTTTASFRFSDMQEFAQLVELRDDELHERVPLRYLRQYVGPSLFNLCSNGEPKAKHVFLFNSSRIIIAINNFSLERMTVMLTPARAIMGSAARCPQGDLECQVYGTRICIDTINACDGVPNCGAYDIYDEDRLMCGGAGGLQHNVYLAAVTFLALLLTLMYTVHYWLKRCVPKVSEAFFIYTNGTENILYLETIMRSPHNIDDNMLKMYHENLPDENYLYPELLEETKQNVIRRFFTACFKYCKFKRSNKQDDIEIEDDFYKNYNAPRKMYSFAELELHKMLHQSEKVDTAVQTGDSLEMSKINILQTKDSIEDKRLSSQTLMQHRHTAKASLSGSSLDSDLQKHVDELSMLKFFKDVKSEHVPSPSPGDTNKLLKRREGVIEEEELRTHNYENQPLEKPSPKQVPRQKRQKTGDPLIELPESSKQAVKRLRFDEEAIAIPYNDEDDDDGIQQTSFIELEDRKKRDHDPHKSESHLSSGTGRDFRFWKSKKSKKKTVIPLEKRGRL